MRARRCNSCGSRFYVDPKNPSSSCQNCDDSHDPSAQMEADAANIELVNNNAGLRKRRQTVDVKRLADDA